MIEKLIKLDLNNKMIPIRVYTDFKKNIFCIYSTIRKRSFGVKTDVKRNYSFPPNVGNGILNNSWSANRKSNKQLCFGYTPPKKKRYFPFMF